MPLDIASTGKRETVALSVIIPDMGTVNLTYDPNQYNWETEYLLTTDSVGSIPAGSISKFCDRMIVTWDILDNGKPIPPTLEGMKRVDWELILTPLMTAIMQDMGENVGKSPKIVSSTPSSTATPQPLRSTGRAVSRGHRSAKSRGTQPG